MRPREAENGAQRKSGRSCSSLSDSLFGDRLTRKRFKFFGPPHCPPDTHPGHIYADCTTKKKGSANMRNQLFKCEIARGDRLVTCYIVAPEEQRASEILIQTEIEANREHQSFALERVDKTLPSDKRKGLIPLLKSGVVGPASYNKAVGWVTHSVPAPKLHFYRIEEKDGDEYCIIAPTGDVAAAIYCGVSDLQEGEGRFFRILDGFFGLKNECLRGLPALLKYGPIGLVTWDDERGWQSV